MNEQSSHESLQPQLVLADLDGTLIVEPNGIGPAAVKLIELTSTTGGAVVPVSARSIANLARLFYEHCQVSFAVGNGGAAIARLVGTEEKYSVLHEETLTVGDGSDFLKDLYELQKSSGGLIFLFHSSESLFEVVVMGDASKFGKSSLEVIIGDRPMTYANDVLPSQGLLGISLLTPLESHQVDDLVPQNLPSVWRASVYPEYRIPGWSWLEVFPKRANKAEACKRVLQLWSTEFDTKPVTTAIGDADDDIGMLHLADRSYCPSTASQKVQEAVSEVLPHPGGDDFAAAVTTRIKTAPG